MVSLKTVPHKYNYLNAINVGLTSLSRAISIALSFTLILPKPLIEYSSKTINQITRFKLQGNLLKCIIVTLL